MGKFYLRNWEFFFLRYLPTSGFSFPLTFPTSRPYGHTMVASPAYRRKERRPRSNHEKWSYCHAPAASVLQFQNIPKVNSQKFAARKFFSTKNSVVLSHKRCNSLTHITIILPEVISIEKALKPIVSVVSGCVKIKILKVYSLNKQKFWGTDSRTTSEERLSKTAWTTAYWCIVKNWLQTHWEPVKIILLVPTNNAKDISENLSRYGWVKGEPSPSPTFQNAPPLLLV